MGRIIRFAILCALLVPAGVAAIVIYSYRSKHMFHGVVFGSDNRPAKNAGVSLEILKPKSLFGDGTWQPATLTTDAHGRFDVYCPLQGIRFSKIAIDKDWNAWDHPLLIYFGGHNSQAYDLWKNRDDPMRFDLHK